ncbi:hypothetical protein MTO96_052136 [Rhipicephalus appendiculatus]
MNAIKTGSIAGSRLAQVVDVEYSRTLTVDRSGGAVLTGLFGRGSTAVEQAPCMACEASIIGSLQGSA